MDDIFQASVTELDELVKNGDLGETSSDLLKKREKLPSDQFLYLSFLSIYGNSDLDIRVANFTEEFLGLFTEAIMADAEATDQIIAASIRGTNDHPELETMSAMEKFLIDKQSMTNKIRTLKGQKNASNFELKELGNITLRNYSNGFEYAMKIFIFLIGLERVIQNKPYDLSGTASLTSSQKLNQFRQLTKGNHSLLVDGWDDRLRNADSHLNIMFDTNTRTFVGRNRFVQKEEDRKIHKVESFEISPTEMYEEVLPRIGNFIQGYLSAGFLLALVNKNRNLYNKAADFMNKVVEQQNLK
ncbi:hypothetical protein [Lactiplantibacillus argentoratensis]|uniref:hypothetical protein n=1 Tax=Lactiplantibacillus argentoratensis TaxID=271881 RepID=UPI001B33BFC8|nr:hypothetical protein [Lactiplantibacillus argentoratensis]MBP5809471.1 hypothetical protein [Lactiplantibacillus argentoratensis]